MEKEITLVLNYLDKLGEKLGIGANMLWPYLMKQQVIEAYLILFLIPLMGAIFYFTWKKYAMHPCRHDEKWKDGMYFYTVTMLVSGALTFFFTVYFLFHGTWQLFNTEYMAFKKLLELLHTIR